MKEQSKKITIATTLIMLAALLFVAVFGVITKGFTDNSLFANNANTNQIEQPNVVDGNGNNIGDGKIYDMPAQMSFSAEALAENGTVCVNISATVTPADAANKLVDWSVAWADGSTDLIVTDYVTVTAQSDGSNVATITCKKAFAKDISVTVTTRQGAFTATCRIIFEGKPTSISYTNSQLTKPNGYYNLPANGNEYAFDLTLDSSLGVVGNKYKNFTFGITASGKNIIMERRVADMDKSMISDTVKDTPVSTAFLMLALEKSDVQTVDEFVKCRIADNKLFIQVNKVLNKNLYINSGQPGDMWRLDSNGNKILPGEVIPATVFSNVFKDWGDDSNYLRIRVFVPNTDLYVDIPFRPVVATNGVSLSNSSLQF